MRTRFCATMRRPACSIMALIAPVRLRAVASGLMMEKVRSTAIGVIRHQRGKWERRAAYSGGAFSGQGWGDGCGFRPPHEPRAVKRLMRATGHCFLTILAWKYST